MSEGKKPTEAEIVDMNPDAIIEDQVNDGNAILPGIHTAETKDESTEPQDPMPEVPNLEQAVAALKTKAEKYNELLNIHPERKLEGDSAILFSVNKLIEFANGLETANAATGPNIVKEYLKSNLKLMELHVHAPLSDWNIGRKDDNLELANARDSVMALTGIVKARIGEQLRNLGLVRLAYAAQTKYNQETIGNDIDLIGRRETASQDKDNRLSPPISLGYRFNGELLSHGKADLFIYTPTSQSRNPEPSPPQATPAPISPNLVSKAAPDVPTERTVHPTITVSEFLKKNNMGDGPSMDAQNLQGEPNDSFSKFQDSVRILRVAGIDDTLIAPLIIKFRENQKTLAEMGSQAEPAGDNL